MTDELTDSTVKPVGNGNLKPFKKGYDPRRWLNGRGIDTGMKVSRE